VREAHGAHRDVLAEEILERASVHATLSVLDVGDVTAPDPGVTFSIVPDHKREVDELRQEMAKLDGQLLAALDKRARAARRLGELHKGSAPTLPLTDHAAIRALVARSNGEMPEDALRAIFREVFAACLALELPVEVAFVGPEGDAGHAAARGRFGARSSLHPVESTAAALEEVTRKRAQFAVVPFETSSEGPVQATIAALLGSDLRVAEVLDATFDLHLMGRTGPHLIGRTGALAELSKVYVTARDHGRCQTLLGELAPGVAVLDVKSPLMACRLAAEEAGAAAVANEAFGAQLGLEVVRRNVLDSGGDRVRYAVVGPRPSMRTGDDVTSLVLSVQDAPGSLLDVLKVFAERGINLTNIQSHPVEGQAWRYLFYVETAGHLTDRPLVMAFEEVKRMTRFFKVLGSYPAP
jgi:chorismate mutase/prephenate dehydratase